MKVLYLINSSDFFASHFLKLAISVKENGHHVCVAAGDSNQKVYFEKLGFSFYEYKLSRSGKNLLTELLSVISIHKLYKEVRPDAVHMLTIKPILYGGFVGRVFSAVAPKKNVASVTGLGSSSMSTGLHSYMLWRTIKLVYRFVLSAKNTKIIFENADDRDLFISSKITSNYNSFLVNGAGVDVDEFTPSINKPEKVSVILVARLLKDKGIREFINAGRMLKEMKVNVELVLVGSVDHNNPSSMSEEEIFSAHNNGYIKSLGHRTDIAHCYQSSHIACLPSYREGLPKSLIEAAACGLPIITTDVPGCRQMVCDGKNGTLVPAKDAHSLALAIKELVLAPERRNSMGVESRKIANKLYGYSSVIGSFFDIYSFDDMEIGDDKK